MTLQKIAKNILQWQKNSDLQLSPNLPFAIRLDGVGFSKFTKQFPHQPFDLSFCQIMQNTTKELVQKFSASLGFCISDEITLLFPAVPQNEDKEFVHLYNGRVSKLNSIVAAYTTMIFNKNLSQFNIRPEAYFDARSFSLPNMEAGLDVLKWRQLLDGQRNCIQSIAHYYYGHKQIVNLNRQEMAYLLLKNQRIRFPEYNIKDFTRKELLDKLKPSKDTQPSIWLSQKETEPEFIIPKELFFGSFVKKAQIMKTGYYPIQKKNVEALRTELKSKSFSLDRINDCKFIYEKYWHTDSDDY